MKKKIGLVAGVLLLLGVIISVVMLNKQTLKLKETVFTFELGDKVSFTPKDFLDESTSKKIKENAELKFKNEYLVSTDNNELKTTDSDYLKVGVYEILLIYDKKTVSFEIKVQDTTKPEFIEFKEEIVLEQNAKDVDLTTFYDAKDLSGVTIVVESDYDITKVGEYNATIKAVDQYKNVLSKQSKIKVVSNEDITESNLTKNLQGATYKSQKRIDNENKPKESHNVVSENKTTTNKNTQSNNSSNQNNNNKSQVSVPTYRRDIANQYVSRINAFRKENGLSELPVTEEAQKEADMRAKQISTNFEHNSSYGFGENIGNNVVGYDFVEAWKNSWSHKNAILREQNTAMAVSIYEVNGMWYAVVSFRMNY